METWDAIRARRDVRQYETRAIARADLERILDAGRRSPSSMNWQPWHFVVATDRDELEALARVWRGAAHAATSAATVAVVAEVVADGPKRDRLLYDLGQATAFMMLEAADLGIGSGHAAVEDQQQARRVLGLPEELFCVYLITFGYPAERPIRPIERPDRRPFDEVVHWDRW